MDDILVEHRDTFAAMAAAFNSAEIQACLVGVTAIAHFDISPERAKPLLRFHQFITAPEPSFITNWRADPKREHWYHDFVNGVLTHVRSGLSAVEYHYQNLRQLEGQLAAFLETVDYKTAAGDTFMSLGGTAKLDYEYQAYVVSYRRCLDYLARAMTLYFMRQGHSFRRLDRGLRDAEPWSVAEAVLTVQRRYIQPFKFVLGVDGHLSVRDRIAHHEAVGAGIFNLSRLGVCLAGGGEDLEGWSMAGKGLGDVLAVRTDMLHRCVEEMLDAFIAAASEVEGAHTR